jgi:hypothetical protein
MRCSAASPCSSRRGSSRCFSHRSPTYYVIAAAAAVGGVFILTLEETAKAELK